MHPVAGFWRHAVPDGFRYRFYFNLLDFPVAVAKPATAGAETKRSAPKKAGGGKKPTAYNTFMKQGEVKLLDRHKLLGVKFEWKFTDWAFGFQSLQD